MSTPVKLNDITYLAPTWQDMGELTFGLAQQIIKSNLKIDCIVALAKGGLEWSRTLADYLKVTDLYSIRVQLYEGIYETSKTPVITQSLPASIQGKHVLIFDDIADTGLTLKIAKEYLSHHGPNSLHTATLYYKPWSKFKPDYYGGETDDWVIFPHDTREMISLLNHKLTGSLEEKIAQMVEIGISEPQVRFFLSLEEGL